MKIVKIDELETVVNPHGVDAKKVYENDNLEVMHLTLKPGEHIVKHQLPVNVFFFVLDGSGIIEIGDEIQKVSKNTLIESNANIPRGWTNDSNELLKLLVVKSPKPTVQDNRQAISDIKRNKQ